LAGGAVGGVAGVEHFDGPGVDGDVLAGGDEDQGHEYTCHRVSTLLVDERLKRHTDEEQEAAHH